MKKLSTEGLKSLFVQGDPFALINVLPTDQFAHTTIPCADNVPLVDADFVAHVEQIVGGKDRTVMVYCGSNQCPASTQAAERLEGAGFTNVLDYKDGAAAWQESEPAEASELASQSGNTTGS